MGRVMRCRRAEHVWSVRESWDGREFAVCDSCGTERPIERGERGAA